MKMIRISIFLSLTSLLVLCLLPVAVSAADPNASEPTYNGATVDGNPGEWDLNADFFANMYRTGDTGKSVFSKLYLRYDCNTSTLYILLLPDNNQVPPVPINILVKPDEVFVNIDGAEYVNGNLDNDSITPDFQWITPIGMYASGWEASTTLPSGSYSLDVNTSIRYSLNPRAQLVDDGPQASAIVECSIPLMIVCDGGGGGGSPEVGGYIFPTNKIAVLAPWLAIVIVASIATIIVVRRRLIQN